MGRVGGVLTGLGVPSGGTTEHTTYPDRISLTKTKGAKDAAHFSFTCSV